MVQLNMVLHENHMPVTTHHQGLRLALGAFRTSPIESLYADLTNDLNMLEGRNCRLNTLQNRKKNKTLLIFF